MKAATSLLLTLVALAILAHASVDLGMRSSYSRTSWTAKDGIPGNSVSRVTQDRDGYLWVGTASGGLARFDGVRFIAWAPVGGAPPPNTGVAGLYADPAGPVWVSWGGTVRVDRIDHGSVTSFGPQDGLADGVVLALQQDAEGAIWAGGRAGLSRFRNGRWEPVHGLDNARPVLTIYKDRQGMLWFGTPAGVFRHDAISDRFELVSGPAEIARGFAEDRDGALWAIDSRLRFKNLRTGKIAQPIALKNPASPWGVFSDSSGRVWVGTQGAGLVRLDRPGSVVAEIYAVENGLAGNSVRSVFEDREGNIWVGTTDGITRFSESRITMLPGGAPSLGGKLGSGGLGGGIQAVTASQDGTLWLGTRTGIVRFSPDRQVYAPLESLPPVDVTALHADADGSLWIGTSHGVARYDGHQLSYLPQTAPFEEISAITTDAGGNLWICDRTKGVYRWRDGALTALDDAPELNRRPVSATYVDSQKRLWLGFFSGAVAVRESGRFRYYPPNDSGLPGGPVISFLEDSGTVWIGTVNGVARVDDKKLTTVILRDSMPGDASAFIQDQQGAVWVGVNDRLLHIDRAAFQKAVAHAPLRYTVYDTSDGLQSGPFFGTGHPNATRDRDGILWFVTTAGVAQVDPSRLLEQKPPPLVTVERVWADGQPLGPSSLLRLDGRPAELRFEYTAPYLRAPSKLRFRHLLEGWDAAWVNDDSNRRTSYARLPPGSYRFRVSASVDGNVWSASNTPVEVNIPAAFYQTRWFAAVCMVIGALVLWGLWRMRMWQIDRQFSLVLAERARVAREMHDTLLQSLVGLSLHLDNLAEEVTASSSPALLKHQLKHMRKQVEGYVIEARDFIWDLRSPEAETQNFILALKEAASRIIEGQDIECDVDVQGQPRTCSGEVQGQLLRIAQEAIRNAVRHADPRRIHVQVHYKDDSVRLEISDDGRGFSFNDSQSRGGDHWGLAILRERASQVGGLADILSSPGAGTTIEVVVPLGANRYADHE